jgi:hypothetical protein
MIGGASTLATFYAYTAASAVFLLDGCSHRSASEADALAKQENDRRNCVTSDVAPLFLPVVGPFISLGLIRTEGGTQVGDLLDPFFIAAGIGQTLGGALLVGGFVVMHGETTSGDVALAPVLGRDGAGLRAVW